LARKPATHRIQLWVQHRRAPQTKLQSLACLAVPGFHEIATVVQEVMMQIDLHRANRGARAAKRGCVGKVLKLPTAQMRRQHRADRPRIGGSVRVPADMAVHRTDIQASAAANAMQHLPLFRMAEQAAATVIHQHYVKFFRAIHFPGASCPADQRSVGRNRLSCARCCQDGPECRQVFEPRNHFFNARDSHMDTRKTGCQPAVPSLVEIATAPTSATRKFAPEIPISAAKNALRSFLRAAATSFCGSSGRSGSPSLSRNSSAICVRLRCMAGVTMWYGGSCRNCTMYSPRSVSHTVQPTFSSAAESSISSVTIDFDLTTVFTACFTARSAMYLRASSLFAAQKTCPPRAV